MHLTNKSLEVKQIESIYIWTDPLINNANNMIDRQPLLSRNLLFLALQVIPIVFISPLDNNKKKSFTFYIQLVLKYICFKDEKNNLKI
jgi:hypothetical protein